jgi:glucose/arabinose dehydrogenase
MPIPQLIEGQYDQLHFLTKVSGMLRKAIALVPLLFACRLLQPTPSSEAGSSSTSQPPLPKDSETAAPLPTVQPVTETPPPPTHTPTPVSVGSLPDPAAVSWKQVATGFAKPLALENVGDARVFVVEQRGMIWIIENDQVIDEPFLDIRGIVNDGRLEQGLLGLAFHPDYKNNGRFYLYFTDAAGRVVIGRFATSSDPNLADPDSLQIVMRLDQPFGNHNGGELAFGMDGMLYIGTGDGGSANDPFGNGQRLDTLLGKILRIDVDAGDPYSVPGDNPFIAQGGQPEIWAYGLRNPWRFTFDTLTGDMYIADVGQNQWEEVNFLPATLPFGVNFGWNLREGSHNFAGGGVDGLMDPVAEYSHQFGCSISGGEVLRDPNLHEWRGVYLFGDWCTGIVWGLLRDTNGQWINEVLFDTSAQISSFGLDAQGRVYMIDHGGSVFRLQKAP